MKATKYYENGHIIVYIEDRGVLACQTFVDEKQMRQVGECLRDLARIGGKTVEIKDEGD